MTERWGQTEDLFKWLNEQNILAVRELLEGCPGVGRVDINRKRSRLAGRC